MKHKYVLKCRLKETDYKYMICRYFSGDKDKQLKKASEANPIYEFIAELNTDEWKLK